VAAGLEPAGGCPNRHLTTVVTDSSLDFGTSWSLSVAKESVEFLWSSVWACRRGRADADW
jgi:hypothetical protein